MRKQITVSMIVMLSLICLVGCGNSAEFEALKNTISEKDAIIVEKDREIDNLNTQINELNATITDLQTQLETLQSEFDSLSEKVGTNDTITLGADDYKGNDPKDLSTQDPSQYDEKYFKMADLDGNGVLDKDEQALYQTLTKKYYKDPSYYNQGGTTSGGSSTPPAGPAGLPDTTGTGETQYKPGSGDYSGLEDIEVY